MSSSLVSDANDGFFGHPRGLATLSSTAMRERFTFLAMAGRSFDIVLHGCSIGLLPLFASGCITRPMGGVR